MAKSDRRQHVVTVIAMAAIFVATMVAVNRITELQAALDRQIETTMLWQTKYNDKKNGEENAARHK